MPRRALCAALAALAAQRGGVVADPIRMPSQFFYTQESSYATRRVDGCDITTWQGTDPDGVAGYPSMSKVDCADGATYEDHGVNLHGHIRFYLRKGSLTVNQHVLKMTGSAVWANEGAELKVSLKGSVYIVGAAYKLSREVTAAHFSTSYLAPQVRAYLVEDAVANRSDAHLGHDPHINNGTTNAKDLLWPSNSTVDPPSIVVLNCAPEKTSYVWYHSHPAGAVYLPFSGRICFQTDQKLCIEPGTARWTSPLLYYYETFEQMPAVVSPEAQEVVAAAGMSACPHAIVFAVTNFDPASIAGQPNFDDVPANGVLGEKWGTFKTMTVRTTTTISRTVVLGD